MIFFKRQNMKKSYRFAHGAQTLKTYDYKGAHHNFAGHPVCA